MNIITRFFKTLTQRNWGWPYHLFFSFAGVEIAFIYFQDYEEWFALALAYFSVNLIGLIYVEIQMFVRKVLDSSDHVENLVANFIGSSLQIGILLYSAPAPLSQVFAPMISKIIYYSPSPLDLALVQLLY